MPAALCTTDRAAVTFGHANLIADRPNANMTAGHNGVIVQKCWRECWAQRWRADDASQGSFHGECFCIDEIRPTDRPSVRRLSLICLCSDEATENLIFRYSFPCKMGSGAPTGWRRRNAAEEENPFFKGLFLLRAFGHASWASSFMALHLQSQSLFLRYGWSIL